MDGSSGERVEKTKEFADMLTRRSGVEIIFQGRTINNKVEAYEIMNEAGIKREDRYKYVDQIAATIILEDYLNSHR